MFRFFTRRLPPYKDSSYAVIHECPDCGLYSGLMPPKAGDNQYCPRCTNILRRTHIYTLDKALAFYVTAAFFYLLTVTTPLLHMILYGRIRSSVFYSGPLMLDTEGLWQVAALVFLTTIVMPLIKIVGHLIVLIGIRLRRRPQWLGHLFAWLRHMDGWAMVEVYLLGFIVAYTRMQAMAHVILGPAVYGIIGLMLSLTAAESVLDKESVWERIPRRSKRTLTQKHNGALLGCNTCHLVTTSIDGMRCQRCDEILYKRKPESLTRTCALALAALILYVPSNIFPIMTVIKAGNPQPYTIIGGMMELAHVGLLPLAALVFCASVVIPMFKLLSLILLLLMTHSGSRWQLHNRTRLYRLIEFIGRWSMVDVFMVSILAALVHFGLLGDVRAEVGVIYFSSVVVLTMIAVKSFDPRLMWDAASEAVPPPTSPAQRESYPKLGSI